MALFSDQKTGETNRTMTLPIDRISDMKANGLSNNQIVESLQREGFSTTQIFDALHQEEIRGSGGPVEMPPLEGNPDQPLNLQAPPQQPPAYQQPSTYPQPPAQQDQGMTEEEFEEKIEEVTETIIEEKWKDFAETIEKIIEWKNAMQEKFDKFENELDFLKQEFDKIHTALIKKIDQYDKGMSDVGAQLKAMEMVFKDVLPKFTENVNVLSSFADKVKKKK